jgi:hypothetical protein
MVAVPICLICLNAYLGLFGSFQLAYLGQDIGIGGDGKASTWGKDCG